MMASVRKVKLTIHTPCALCWLNYIFDSLLLHLAQACLINMGSNDKEINRALALYKTQMIQNSNS